MGMEGTGRKSALSRSPHGERGLKCLIRVVGGGEHEVALLTESVD